MARQTLELRPIPIGIEAAESIRNIKQVLSFDF